MTGVIVLGLRVGVRRFLEAGIVRGSAMSAVPEWRLASGPNSSSVTCRSPYNVAAYFKRLKCNQHKAS